MKWGIIFMGFLYQYLWFFFFYSFLGWCSEVCFAAIKNGHFVNRGLLNGPYCPIYGFGVCIVVFCLTPLEDSIPMLFAGSVIVASALEFVTGFLLEKLFHQKWWDYSHMPFNIGGYICPLFSLLWGLVCVFIFKFIHPLTAKLISAIPPALGLPLLCVMCIAIFTDLAATVATILKLNQKLRRLDELAARMRAASDDIGSVLSDRTLTLAARGAERRSRRTEKAAACAQEDAARRAAREKAIQRRNAALRELKAANEELLSTYHFGQRRLLRAFPHMRSVHHAEALEQMKQRLRSLKK